MSDLILVLPDGATLRRTLFSVRDTSALRVHVYTKFIAYAGVRVDPARCAIRFISAFNSYSDACDSADLKDAARIFPHYIAAICGEGAFAKEVDRLLELSIANIA